MGRGFPLYTEWRSPEIENGQGVAAAAVGLAAAVVEGRLAGTANTRRKSAGWCIARGEKKALWWRWLGIELMNRPRRSNGFRKKVCASELFLHHF
jgi:hypothetical protein